MGGVALLFMLATLGLKFIKYIIGLNADDYAKVNRSLLNDKAYIDNNGKMRLKSNGHIVTHTVENGHYVLKDLKTLEILRDYTLEKEVLESKQSLNKAIKNGQKIYCVDFNTHQSDKIKGMRYRNRDTNEIYVIRHTLKYNIPFYMDLNGKFIEPVDKNWNQTNLFGIGNDIKIDIQKEIQRTKETALPNEKSFNYLWNEMLDIQYCGRRYGENVK